MATFDEIIQRIRFGPQVPPPTPPPPAPRGVTPPARGRAAPPRPIAPAAPEPVEPGPVVEPVRQPDELPSIRESPAFKAKQERKIAEFTPGQPTVRPPTAMPPPAVIGTTAAPIVSQQPQRIIQPTPPPPRQPVEPTQREQQISEAEQKAKEKVQEEQAGPERAKEIYEHEFGLEGLKLVERDDGTFTVTTIGEFTRQQDLIGERGRIQQRMTGTPEERIQEFTRFVSLSVIKPVSFLAPVIGEAIFGGEQARKNILNIIAEQTTELQGKGIGEIAISSYTDPGGLGFIGTVFAVAPHAIGLLGKVGGPGGAILKVGVPTVLKGAIVTTVGVDIGVAAVKGPEEVGKRIVQHGAFFGLAAGFGLAATGRPLLPKVKRHIVYEPKTGRLAEQKYIDVLGKQLKIPGIKLTTVDSFHVSGFTGAKPFGVGISFKTTVPPAPAKQPFVGGLSAKPSTVPLVISKFGDVTFVDTGIIKPTVTGLPMPGVYTGRQPVLRGPRPLVELKPLKGELVIKEPELPFQATTESFEKNLKFLGKAKTTEGIKPPSIVKEPLIKEPILKDIFPRKPLRIKPVKDTVTKLGISPEGVISLEKYGAKLITIGKAKTTGLPLPGEFTGRQPVLRGLRPLVEVKRIPGRIIPIEETFPLIKIFESGLSPQFEGLIKITPKVKGKPIRKTLRDIIGDEETRLDKLAEKGGVVRSGDTKLLQLTKQKTITKVKQLELKSITKEKVITEKITLQEQRQMQISDRKLLETMLQQKLVTTKVKQVTDVRQEGIFGLSFAQQQKQKSLQEQVVMLKHGTPQMQKTIQDVVSIQGKATAEVVIEEPMFERIYAPVIVRPIVVVPPPVVKPPVTKPPEEPTLKQPQQKGLLLFQADLIREGLETPVYNTFVLKTQYSNGVRIRGRVKEKLNKRPLRRSDALALGSNVTDNTAKRTIIIERTDGKPSKMRKRVRPWSLQALEYRQKDENTYVEVNAHAIDSPGEIREITMKGISARKRGGRSRRSNSMSGFGLKRGRRLIV